MQQIAEHLFLGTSDAAHDGIDDDRVAPGFLQHRKRRIFAGGRRQLANRCGHLAADVPVPVLCQRENSLDDRRVGRTEIPFGDSHSRRAHFAPLVGQRLLDRLRIDSLQPVKGPQGVQLRAPVRRRCGKRAQ